MSEERLNEAEKRRKIAELESLVRHPGWLIVSEDLDIREARAIRDVARGAGDLEHYARLGAQIDLIRRVRNFPIETASELARSLPTEDT